MSIDPDSEPGGADELRVLMRNLGLRDGRALATVVEVGQDITGQWLSGSRPVPLDVVTMLRGLAAIHSGPEQS